MWFSHLFLHLLQQLGGYSEERATEKHDKEVAERQHRRRSAHSDVPSLAVIEAKHGERLPELVGMLVASDPANLRTRRSRNGDDPKHVELIHRRYRLLAWTLIHRSTPDEAIDSTATILAKELSLWFGTGHSEELADGPEGLLARLIRWRKRWDFA
jgi:hypothetical protein